MVIYIREKAAKAQRQATLREARRPTSSCKSEKHAFKLETVVEGLDDAVGPGVPARRPHAGHREGRAAPHRREGRARCREPVGGVPAVWSKGQGACSTSRVHPDYAKNGWIYLSYSDPGPNDSAMTAVVRGKLKDGALVEQQTLFKAPAELYRTGNVHFGSRFVFDGKGHVFFSIGERGQQGRRAGPVTRPNGKVHRIHDDGRDPDGQPVRRQGRRACRASGATATATRRGSRCTRSTGEL